MTFWRFYYLYKRFCIIHRQWTIMYYASELNQIVNMDQIPNYSVFENFTNTELFGFWKWMNTKYRIVLFGLNYLNTEFKNRIVAPQKILYVNFVTKWDEENLILYFHIYMRAFYCFFYTYLAYKKSRTIRYLVTTIWVFTYYSEITNGPNTEYE